MKKKTYNLREFTCELTSSWPPAHVEVGLERHFLAHFAVANYEGKLRTKLRTKLRLFSKTETFVFWHIAEISARYRRQNDRTDVAHLFCFQKTTTKTQFGLFFPGCVFWWGVRPTRKGPGPRGPGPTWALAHMGPGPYGPWPIWQIISIPDF